MYSFARQKKTVNVFPYIRRICDLSTPNLATVDTGRSDNRFNRTLPTLICPWEDDAPVADEASICLTSDLSDRGIGLVLSQPFRAERVVLGYWLGSEEMPEAWYFLGDIRRSQAIGGGFWLLGVQLTEFANTDYRDELASLRTVASRLAAQAPIGS